MAEAGLDRGCQDRLPGARLASVARVEQRVAAASFEQIEAWSAPVLSAAKFAGVLTD